MALQNPRLFGYEVEASLADVENSSLALRRLNLPAFDLEVIRGAANAGMIRNDWYSFSRLKVPLVKTLARFREESASYAGFINERAGTDGILFGNLDINGSLNGKAIRYTYLQYPNAPNTSGATVGIADISTSRVSAWSSSVPENLMTVESPISYGAQVATNATGGEVEFGNRVNALASGNSQATGYRLQTTLTPLKKEFNSETPTHKIRLRVGAPGDPNGEYVWAYAMKGIPYVLKGFFRNLDAEVKINLKDNKSVSWKIVEVANSNSFTNYADRGTTTSTVQYRSVVDRARFIQIYYDPDYITSIKINSANISKLPSVQLAAANSLNFSSNNIKVFPNFAFIAPSLTTLSMSNNPLSNTEIAVEEFLGPEILDKIPNTVTTLDLGGCFWGSIRGGDVSGHGVIAGKNIIAHKLPNLVNLYLGGSGPYFYDDDKGAATVPQVPINIKNCEVWNNSFTTFGGNTNTQVHNPASPNSTYPKGAYLLYEAPNLERFRVTNNRNLGGTFSITSTVIQEINISGTSIVLPNASNKSQLTNVQATHTPAFSLFQTCFDKDGNPTTDANAKVRASGYKLAGCDALSTLNLFGADLSNDRFPIFNNASLTSLNLTYTSIKGGSETGNETHVIPDNTFSLSTNLQDISIVSDRLLKSSIANGAFSNLASLSSLYYYSYGRTSGNLPDFSGCTALYTLNMEKNDFTGGVPMFGSNLNLHTIRLNNNRLSGAIPSFSGLTKLTYIYLYNNQLTSMAAPGLLGSLYRLEAHNNQISGPIPDFTGCTNLYYLILFNNQFSSYTPLSFASLRRIKYIDLANNNLSQQSIGAIITDLVTNLMTYGSGRSVTINLRGNATPSEDALEDIDVLKDAGWSVTFS